MISIAKCYVFFNPKKTKKMIGYYRNVHGSDRNDCVSKLVLFHLFRGRKQPTYIGVT